MRFYNVPNIIPTSAVLNTTVGAGGAANSSGIGSGGGAVGAIFVEEYYQ